MMEAEIKAKAFNMASLPLNNEQKMLACLERIEKLLQEQNERFRGGQVPHNQGKRR